METGEASVNVFLDDPTFKTSFLAALETLLNRTLALDPVCLGKLQALQGKVVTFACIEPGFQCYVSFDSQGVRLAGFHEAEVDAYFQGSMVAFIGLAARRDMPFTEVPGLEVSGCQDLLGQLEATHRELELDWESLVCQALGDVTGHLVAEGIRFFRSRLGYAGKAISSDAGRYLQEELKLLPPAAEVHSFINDLGALQQDLLKLEARVADLYQPKQP